MGEWRYSSPHSSPQCEVEVSGQLHAPGALPPGKKPLVHIKYDWVGSTAGLDALEKRKMCPYFSVVQRVP
jgi:hypothetical protein